MKIFLSHSTRDTEIATTLKALLRAVFGDAVEVSFSSDQAAGGGIDAGEKWREWINKEIAEADQTHVLLTPNSMSRPWILWESGVAAGVSLGNPHAGLVVPVAFGLSADEIPSPLQDIQAVKGDTAEPNGIHRLLQCVNEKLTAEFDAGLSDDELEAETNLRAPDYLVQVKEELDAAAPVEALLASTPAAFSAKKLEGFWATSYEFVSDDQTMYHADIAEISAESGRWLLATNSEPAPRTEKHHKPFRNDIDAQLVRRHVIGHWKNTDDTSYFGAIHLAVLPGDDVMDGYYTAFASDGGTGAKPWRWVRIDKATMEGKDLPALELRDPKQINELLRNHSRHDGCIELDDLIGPDDPVGDD